MYVCICNKVSDSAIQHELESGRASSFEDVQKLLGVATQCGKCTGCAKRIVRKHQASQLFNIPVVLEPLPSTA